uniref:Putative salivary kunitz domain protein n=1 Tax=Ixodes ricinus TaxID=34613 RepID=A0A0K8RF90_IXORI
MRSCFIFCLLAMCYIASANATSCWDVAPCRRFCEISYGNYDLTTEAPGTPCTMPGVKDGKCAGGECKRYKRD